MTPDRIMPQAIDAERTVLGSMLIERAAREIGLRECEPADFYAPDNRRVFLALCKYPAGTDDMVDPVRLADMIGGDDAAALVGELSGSMVTVGQLSYYIGKLKDTAARRDAIEQHQREIERAYNLEIPFEAVASTGGLPEPFSTTTGKICIPAIDEPLIDGVMLRHSKAILGAQSKARKTFLALNLGVSIAHGIDFFGKKCTPSKVLYINFELKPGTILNRLAAICSARGVPFECENIDILNLRGCCYPVEDLTPMLVKTIRTKEYSVVIIDPLYKLMQSSKIRQLNENALIDMTYILSHLDQIMKECGVSILVVHHFPKGAAGGKQAIDRFSGSGGFAREFDVLLPLSELDEEGSYRFEIVSRELPPIEPLSLRWEYPLHHVDATLYGVQLKGALSRPKSREERIRSVQNDDDTLQRLIYDNPKESKRSITAAAMQSGISKERARCAIDRLITKKIVETIPGNRNSILLACSSVPVFQCSGTLSGTVKGECSSVPPPFRVEHYTH